MTWGMRGIDVLLGERSVLTDVDLDARDGSVVAVAGADGAGKTTLLRVLGGALEPDAGSVSRPDPQRIGYMPASSGVYPDLSVRENLEFAALVYGVPSREVTTRVEPVLERLGLVAVLDRPGGKLSGGMRQKLGLVMATLHRPGLLILDEPTTGVDPVSRTELARLLGRAAADGTAVVAATTYLDEAERAASILVLHEGRTLLRGTVDEILAGVPGSLLRSSRRPPSRDRWRRGDGWRVWSPDGDVPPGAEHVAPDLQDAVTVAALAARRERIAA
jgi:ABC-2 type transport system ATP-binding protein